MGTGDDDADRAIRKGSPPARSIDGSSTTGAPTVLPGTHQLQGVQKPLSSETGSLISAHGRLGKYVIERELGRGGMGVVYLARDTIKQELGNPNHLAALKVLSANFRDNPQFETALEREADKAQQLAHPNILTVYNFDRANEVPYVAMEYIEGETLKDLLERRFNGFAARDAIIMLKSMAGALSYAHEKGFTHSDFKPGNVMIARDGTVKVLDFGLARAISTNVADRFDAAQLGGFTEQYSSPEVLAEQPSEAADDVFALGIVAYELLTGEHPFDGRTADDVDLGSIRVPAAKGLKGRERAAIQRALAPTRAARQPDAGTFLQELRPPPVRPWLYGATAILAISLAIVSYLNVRLEPPEIAYEDLPTSQRVKLDELVALGDGFFTQNVYQGAFDAYVRAYLVSEREPLVVERIESFFDELTDRQDLPANAAENLSCKLTCLRTNFEFFDSVRGLETAGRRTANILAGQEPRCGRCPDYRKAYDAAK